MPPRVERELRRDLECGILAHGFARAYCDVCGHDFLVAFSCKERGICPLCTAKRMSLTAAHLMSSVIPPGRPIALLVAYLLSRTLMPILARSLLHGEQGDAAARRPTVNPFALSQGGFKSGGLGTQYSILH